MKKSILIPITLGVLASAVITGCGGGSKGTGKKEVKPVCKYDIQGGNAVSIMKGAVYANPAVKVKSEGKDVTFKVEGSVDSSKPGSYKMTYSSESCPNTQVRTVTVVAPASCSYSLSGENPLKIHVGDTFTDPGVVITNGSGATVTGTSTGDVDTSVAGSYKISYAGEGCKNTQIRTVEVLEKDVVISGKNCTYSFADNTNPLTIFKGSTYSDVKPTVKNAAGEEITGNAIVVKSNNVDTGVLNDDYKVVYEAEGCLNTGERTVMVKLPNCAYKFPNGNSVNLIVGQDYVPPKVAIENMDNVYATVLEGEVKKDTIGTYSLTYGAKDICANTTNLVVNVKEMTKEELKVRKDKIAEIILP